LHNQSRSGSESATGSAYFLLEAEALEAEAEGLRVEAERLQVEAEGLRVEAEAEALEMLALPHHCFAHFHL
jgi:hypothetical protein